MFIFAGGVGIVDIFKSVGDGDVGLIFLILGLLVVIDFFWEIIHQALHMYAKESGHVVAMYNGIINELAVVGIISLVLFVITTSGGLEEHTVHVFEAVHLSLFAVVIVHFLILLFTSITSILINEEFKRNEEKGRDGCYSKNQNVSQKYHNTPGFVRFFNCVLVAKKWRSSRAVRYWMIRDLFVESHQLQENFPFYRYIARCQRNIYEHIASVHWSVLLLTSLVQCAIYIPISINDIDMSFAVLISCGVITFVFSLLYYKTHRILFFLAKNPNITKPSQAVLHSQENLRASQQRASSRQTNKSNTSSSSSSSSDDNDNNGGSVNIEMNTIASDNNSRKQKPRARPMSIRGMPVRDVSKPLISTDAPDEHVNDQNELVYSSSSSYMSTDDENGQVHHIHHHHHHYHFIGGEDHHEDHEEKEDLFYIVRFIKLTCRCDCRSSWKQRREYRATKKSNYTGHRKLFFFGSTRIFLYLIELSLFYLSTHIVVLIAAAIGALHLDAWCIPIAILAVLIPLFITLPRILYAFAIASNVGEFAHLSIIRSLSAMTEKDQVLNKIQQKHGNKNHDDGLSRQRTHAHINKNNLLK